MRQYSCYLSLGGNLGHREIILREALTRLAAWPDTELCAVSSFYETAPWGEPEQPDFFNAAAHIRTDSPPGVLLERIHSLEQALGRVRGEHWGARRIDIDIIHIEGISMDSEELTIPHPYWKERSFVLIPLAEIAGAVLVEGRPVREWMAACRDEGEVRKVPGSPMDFRLKLLACVDRNWGIGREGELLFHFPEDMKRFRRDTMGHTVILGRKTFEEFPGGKPLAGRRHLLLSRQKEFPAGGVFPEAVERVSGLGRLWEALRTEEENFVLGGAEVYEELLPYCREAFVTFSDTEAGADLFLRNLDRLPEFRLREAEESRDPATGIRLEFRHYERTAE